MMENMGIAQKCVDLIIDSTRANNFAQALGIVVSKVGPGFVEHTMILQHDHTNPYSAVHGGVLMSFADIAMGNAVRSLGIKGLTLDCSTAFIATAYKGDQLRVRAEILKAGRRIIYAEAKVWCDETLLANVTGTFMKIGEV